MKHYNYIFAGAGLASLMTVYRMAVSGLFNDKSILLLDIDAKKTNDRTWCFWHEGSCTWDSILFKKWNTAIFKDTANETCLDFSNYQYAMIRGGDFYNFVFKELEKYPNIEFARQRVFDFADSGFNVLVKTETENYTCNKLFNSIYNPTITTAQKKHPVLQQHFTGWRVRTTEAVFDLAKPVFMDFSIPQKGNTRFMYVLPFSETEAIVEYTLFSKDRLLQSEYEQAIEDYLKTLGAATYEILEEEQGNIPMTSYPFWKHNTKNILNIGTAGGWTKASTGYTFKNADKYSARLVSFLKDQDDFTTFHKKSRFWFYDLLLLDILAKKNHKGSHIFSSMFKGGKASSIFKFLDEETTFMEDLSVISKCPKGLFLAALFRRIVNL